MWAKPPQSCASLLTLSRQTHLNACKVCKRRKRYKNNSIVVSCLVDHRSQGNAAFKAGDFPTAVGHYSVAFLADPSNPTYPLNRAAAYLKLGKWVQDVACNSPLDHPFSESRFEDAARDCSTALKLDPENVKAWFRRGQAELALEALDEAKAGA